MNILGFTLLFLLLTVSYQATSPKEPVSRQIAATKIVNDGGWDIPFINQSSKLNQIKIEEKPYPGLPPFSVKITTYQPQKPKKKDLNLQKLPFFTINGDKLHVHQAHLLITEIVQYSVENKIFRYQVTGYSVVDTPQGVDLGAQYFLYFFDMDGDGKFETLDYEPGLPPKRIPKWVIPNK
ncbi:MAG: hypothetical protein HY774_27700 [Acidobacteria bacterium]|nr:hypothetical protein [Acidobacteriota bacterium]